MQKFDTFVLDFLITQAALFFLARHLFSEHAFMNISSSINFIPQGFKYIYSLHYVKAFNLLRLMEFEEIVFFKFHESQQNKHKVLKLRYTTLHEARIDPNKLLWFAEKIKRGYF